MEVFNRGLSIEKIGDIEVMKAASLEVYADHITHAFSTRNSGASRGEYSSLNLSWRRSDDIENIKSNYQGLCQALDLDVSKMVLAEQTHSPNVAVVTKNDIHNGRFQNGTILDTDALITNEHGLVLVARTADCVPILIYDPSGAIASVHSGWRGTAENICGNTIMKMVSKFGSHPSDIIAVIGPAIGPCCYEVSSDVAEVFKNRYEKVNCVTEKHGKYHLDLTEVCAAQLLNSGLSHENITISDECTSCCPQRYFSHRRDKGITGGMAAFISLK